MVKMYMSDSDEDTRVGPKKNGRVQVPDDSDESVLGLEDSDDDLDDDLSEDDDDQGQSGDKGHDEYDYEDFDEEEDEFGNVHAIRAKKQEMGSDIEDENEDCKHLQAF
jgi:hypothetical protein